MFIELLPFLFVQTDVVTTARAHVMSTADSQIETLAVRLSSPEGVLWQGHLRVGANQSASYSQNLSQASPEICPSGSPYDRSERSAISFNVYVQNSGQWGPSYRVDASWSRPLQERNCSESGTRTVQLNHTLVIEPGQTSVVEGDAGLKVEVTRAR